MVKKNAFKIIWDKCALADFKEILTHLSKQSQQAPSLVKNGVLTRLEIIKTNPLICETDTLKEKPDQNFRTFVVFSYRITYQIKKATKEIRVIRVRHTSLEPLGY